MVEMINNMKLWLTHWAEDKGEWHGKWGEPTKTSMVIICGAGKAFCAGITNYKMSELIVFQEEIFEHLLRQH